MALLLIVPACGNAKGTAGGGNEKVKAPTNGGEKNRKVHKTITGVPGGTAALMLDWSQMQTNALGAQFKEGYVTSAVVGHYTQTPAELEAAFLDLDSIATATYRAAIDAGSVLDFTMLKDAGGAPFPGIDDSGTWLVGLFCGNCRNPAPWYMTILKTCAK